MCTLGSRIPVIHARKYNDLCVVCVCVKYFYCVIIYFFLCLAFQTEGKLYLVLEFLRGGDLFTRLSKEVCT